MYVKRLKLYGVKGFRLDLPKGGESDLAQATRKRMLLQGGNGSGKTTVLGTIPELWRMFGQMIDETSTSFRFPENSRWHGELNAMELGDFPTAGHSFWIAVGNANGIEDLRKANPDAPIASMVVARHRSHIELPSGDWRTIKTRSQEGVEPLPNVVYFPPEGRSLVKVPRDPVRRLDLYDYNWLAQFDSDFDFDSLLFTMRALHPERYEAAIALFNLMLKPTGKRVASLEYGHGRLEIERIEEPRPPSHSWIALSSGERQMLLLVIYTVCLLRENSILIIDEPDLHIHIAMVTQLMETLERTARERKGQLIVASHSQLVWDWFARDEERIQLGPWRGEPE